jgi:hypothetical protein
VQVVYYGTAAKGEQQESNGDGEDGRKVFRLLPFKSV